MGITDINRKMSLSDMARGDVMFAATGVTDGWLLAGVKFNGDSAVTETLVLRAKTGTVRKITSTIRHVDTRYP
jgi:fructose-1,6-bisphosphatase II / sedoheptulose-1,7-bisphosphatase